MKVYAPSRRSSFLALVCSMGYGDRTEMAGCDVVVQSFREGGIRGVLTLVWEILC